MDLQAIQQELNRAGIDGWLFCDFHHRDILAYRILGLDSSAMTSRRWFYYIPSKGEPVKLSHAVEPRKLESLPGRQIVYRAWTELHENLKQMLKGQGNVAMQYSPMNNIPYVSIIDAGTFELVQSCGVKVVSSAGLVQIFEAGVDDAAIAGHAATGVLIHQIKDEAFALMDQALRTAKPITEYQVAQFILSRFREEGLTSHGDSPIVGFNDHPSDCHFEPTEENAYSLHHDDTILIDLWAAVADPPGMYYDITWCGFAGEEPRPMYVEIWKTVCQARDEALEFVKNAFEAGRKCHGYEVDRVSRQVVEKAGYGDNFVHRTGHSIGFEVHGNGANIDDLETRDDRLLVPGICFSLEPGIYLEGRFAVRAEIDVCITPAGKVEVFGPIQQDLILVG
jgi:Xaa-Pro dipeptidase